MKATIIGIVIIGYIGLLLKKAIDAKYTFEDKK